MAPGNGEHPVRAVRRGNWTIRDEGTLFKPAWFEECYLQEEELPSWLTLCRAWDTAASEEAGGYTAGVPLGRSREGLWYVLDARRIRRSPLGVERFITGTAERDQTWARGRDYEPPVIVMEQEPASSGKAMIDHYRRNVLAAHDFRGVSPSGSKVRRAEIVSARAEAKDVLLCRGDWIGEFLDELAAFPHGSHDDQVDALSAAYAYLAQKDEVPIVAPVGFTRQSRWHIPSVTDGWPWP